MHADLVFTGGPVHLGNAARSRATAVAVTGERIVAVGHDEVSELVGPRHRGRRPRRPAADPRLPGRARAPGRRRPRARRVRPDRRGRPRRVPRPHRGVRRGHPDAAWITGGGWSMESFPGGIADRALLDELVPDRPVFLPNRDHHGAWVNTRALEIAGIDARTPDPVDGRIERDADGDPTGMLQEGAMELVAAHCPADDRGRAARGPAPRPGAAALPRHHRAGRTPLVGADGPAGRRGRRLPGRARPRTCSPPGSSARCGGSATGASSRSTSCSRGARS